MASTFYTTAKVAAARRNIARYEWARTLQSQAMRAADRYVAKGEDWLWSLVTGQRLPRSYAVNQLLGSPITGTEIFTFGNYPWQADPLSRPWKLADPSSEYVFPTNDFEAYYRSGLDAHALFDRERADRRLLVNTLYPQRGPTWGVDDGYGWIDDQGHKWTFIAYYNHWFTWYGTGAVHTAMRALRDAYVYSGEVRYARAGLILLDRIADVYPSMDTAPYKRADGFLHSDGGTGRGKIVGSIWETGLVRDFVSAYDAFFPAIATADVANVVPFLRAKARQFGLAPKESVEAIKQHVEDNLLRQVFSATKEARIRGNFGMHQSALAMAAVVLDHPSESKEWIDWMFKSGRLETSPEYRLTGGNFLATLVDDVDRDGFGNEAAPGYNHLWIANAQRVADILAGYQRYPAADLYRHVKLKKLFASRHSLVMINRYQPSIGDSGSTGNPGLPGSRQDYVRAFEAFGLPVYAQMAYLVNGGKVDGLYGDIFSPDVEGTQRRIQEVIDTHGPLSLPPQNLSGYGFAALRTSTAAGAAQPHGMWLYYGRNTGHGHADALNLGMHGFGADLLPDLGYPEFADSNNRRLEWNGNTIAHNTVVVDAQKQARHWVGLPHGFASTRRVQLMDIAAPGVYPQTSTYRRVTALIAVDDARSYAVDVFRVVGGRDHHFSFHAAEGPVTTDGLTLTRQSGGTYAGPDVPLPPETAPPRPTASGFDWLTEVERDAGPRGPFSVDWAIRDTWGVHNPDPDLHLRLTMLGPVDDVALADGTPPRNKPGNPRSLRYLIAHRHGDNLASQFVSVIEPYVGQRTIRAITPATLQAQQGQLAPHEATAIKVELSSGRVDYIVSSLRHDLDLRVDGQFTFRGSFGVCLLRQGRPEYALLHHGTLLHALQPGQAQPPLRLAAPWGAIEGTLLDFTRELADANQLRVQTDHPVPPLSQLVGSYVYVANDGVRNACYQITGARREGTTLVLDIGDSTTVRRYADPADFSKGFIYDVAPGARVCLPLTLEHPT